LAVVVRVEWDRACNHKWGLSKAKSNMGDAFAKLPPKIVLSPPRAIMNVALLDVGQK